MEPQPLPWLDGAAPSRPPDQVQRGSGPLALQIHGPGQAVEQIHHRPPAKMQLHRFVEKGSANRCNDRSARRKVEVGLLQHDVYRTRTGSVPIRERGPGEIEADLGCFQPFAQVLADRGDRQLQSLEAPLEVLATRSQLDQLADLALARFEVYVEAGAVGSQPDDGTPTERDRRDQAVSLQSKGLVGVANRRRWICPQVERDPVATGSAFDRELQIVRVERAGDGFDLQAMVASGGALAVGDRDIPEPDEADPETLVVRHVRFGPAGGRGTERPVVAALGAGLEREVRAVDLELADPDLTPQQREQVDLTARVLEASEVRLCTREAQWLSDANAIHAERRPKGRHQPDVSADLTGRFRAEPAAAAKRGRRPFRPQGRRSAAARKSIATASATSNARIPRPRLIHCCNACLRPASNRCPDAPLRLRLVGKGIVPHLPSTLHPGKLAASSTPRSCTGSGLNLAFHVRQTASGAARVGPLYSRSGVQEAKFARH